MTDSPKTSSSAAGRTAVATVLEELTRAQCLDLLAATELGRVVVLTAAHRPVIRPVNYRFDEPTQSVVFRTGAGSKLHALIRAAKACFEIDAFEPETRSGWSVIIVGLAEEVTRATEIRRLDGLGLDSLGAEEPRHWVRIHAATVSGRRIASAANTATG